jgi:uncharacterized protein YaeQ
MALKSTIHKASLSIADIDHSYYADLELTLARHPSETEERMMIRLLAMAINAHEVQDLCGGDGVLAFGAGLSDPDDPDLSLKDFDGSLRLWVEVGQPEEKPLTKACHKAEMVRVYCFHHAADVWWKRMEKQMARHDHLQVLRIPSEASLQLAAMADRNMALQVTVQDGATTVSTDKAAVYTSLERWK